MMPWTELVELFEYKVADVLEGRQPRGGKRSLADLRSELLAAPLEPPLQRRLAVADRLFRAFTKTGQAPHPARPPAPSFPAPASWQAPITVNPEEALAWDELQRLSWHDRVLEGVQALTSQWTQELNLLTMRVLYTAVENAERLLHPSQERLTVPAASDPLVNLLDRSVVQELTQTLANLLLAQGGEGRLRAALSELHETPFPRHADEDVLASRIAAVERERRTAEERESLIRALQEQYPLPRDPRDRPAIREAVKALAQKLEPLLSSAPRPSQGTVPAHSILYAAQPDLAQAAPDDSADELMLFLQGGQAVQWRGLDWRWQYISPNWQLQAGSQVLLLRPKDAAAARHVLIDGPHGKFKAFLSGAYLLLRAEISPQEELGRRAALGRAVSVLLDPSGDYAYLRLARATAQLLRDGRVEARTLGARSADRYKVASQDALLNFARKGVGALLSRLAALSPDATALKVLEAGRAIAVDDERATRLSGALHRAQFQPETLPSPVSATHVELPMNGVFVSLLVPDEPLTLLVGARAVTLRHDFQGRLAAVIPGHAAQYLQDLLVLRLPDLCIVLARHGRWLAAAASFDDPEPDASSRHPTLFVGPLTDSAPGGHDLSRSDLDGP
ncbi:hypothetical protein [Deinococcus koreensis]|uniref:hypothetical protein n=1 Tax=Deinococcus koreensis TaxID=2054903 RepID=UPI001A9D39CB|nr:hypothetical protein [Deinococcus koreensis]